MKGHVVCVRTRMITAKVTYSRIIQTWIQYSDYVTKKWITHHKVIALTLPRVKLSQHKSVLFNSFVIFNNKTCKFVKLSKKMYCYHFRQNGTPSDEKCLRTSHLNLFRHSLFSILKTLKWKMHIKHVSVVP